jgi:hypothetical protein
VCRRFRTIPETGGIAVREQRSASGKVIRAVKTMGGGVVVCSRKLADMTDEICVRTAKDLLVEKTGMAEDEVYRFIQRKCMERSMRMEEVARLILEAYEAKD